MKRTDVENVLNELGVPMNLIRLHVFSRCGVIKEPRRIDTDWSYLPQNIEQV